MRGTAEQLRGNLKGFKRAVRRRDRELDELKAEIERLQTELEAQYDHNANLDREIERLRADNAWLRAENDGLKEANELCGKNYTEAMATIRELKERQA